MYFLWSCPEISKSSYQKRTFFKMLSLFEGYFPPSLMALCYLFTISYSLSFPRSPLKSPQTASSCCKSKSRKQTGTEGKAAHETATHGLE